jgi:hypothetical protein
MTSTAFHAKCRLEVLVLCVYSCARVYDCEIRVHVVKAVTRTTKACNLRFTRYAVVRGGGGGCGEGSNKKDRKKIFKTSPFQAVYRRSTPQAVFGIFRRARCEVICDHWCPKLNKHNLQWRLPTPDCIEKVVLSWRRVKQTNRNNFR